MQVAGNIAPPVRKINSLQALARLRPKRGNEWCTFAFVLNRDMIKSDGTLDELHAVVFMLGAFDDQKLAEEHAKNVIAITGHPGVIAAPYGSPVPLTIKFNPQAVVEVPVDLSGKLIELESSQYKRENEEYERRVKIEHDIMKEAEEETDPDNIEHFKRQCYLAIKNKCNYYNHRHEADVAFENYKKREAIVRDHYTKYPDHERDWLPYLKKKLAERGEISLYDNIEAAYKEIREELLGLVKKDISCECPENVCPGSLHHKNNDIVESLISDMNNHNKISNEVICENNVCLINKSVNDTSDIEDLSNDSDDIIDSVEIREKISCENGVCYVDKQHSVLEPINESDDDS